MTRSRRIRTGFAEDEPAEAQPAAEAGSRRAAPRARAPQQLGLFDVTPGAAARPAAAAAGGSAPLLAPHVLDFRHPQADRRIAIGALDVHYRLQRVRRRSIGMVVGPDGLEVRAPRWVGLREIEAALREKSHWIERRLHEQRERGARLARARVVWRDGAELPYLGRGLRLVLDPTMAQATLQEESHGPSHEGTQIQASLRLGLAADAAPEAIRDQSVAWLKRSALAYFATRVELYAPRLNVQVARLTLSAAETRWGSASVEGRIRLNWRLIHLDPALIDYVVVHELAHLRVMDHSPRFWALVREVLPDVDARKAALRDPALPVWE